MTGCALASHHDETGHVGGPPGSPPCVDAAGHLLRIRLAEADDLVLNGIPWESAYLQMAWLPIAGATAVCLVDVARSLVPAGTIDVSDLSAMLGLSTPRGNRSKVFDSIDRCARFRLAAWDPRHGRLTIPTTVPPLSPPSRTRLAERLGPKYLDAVDELAALYLG